MCADNNNSARGGRGNRGGRSVSAQLARGGQNNPYRQSRPYRGWGGGRFNRFNAAPREKPVTLSIPNYSINPVEFESTSASNNLSFPGSSGLRVAPLHGQPPISLLLDRTPNKYPAWKLYHTQEEFSEGSKTVKYIRAMEEHFRSNENVYNLIKIRKDLWFPLYIETLIADAKFNDEWPKFREDLYDNPDYALACAGLAMHQTILDMSSSESVNLFMTKIKARIYGFSPIVTLQSLKVNIYGKMVSTRGTIIRVGSSSIECTWMAFECSTCKTQQAIKQPGGIYTVPSQCRDGCRSRGNFLPILNSPYTRTEAFQEIRLQESLNSDSYESGRVPRNIEIEISEDLVDCVCPGDEVTVTGILKVKPQDEFTRRDQANLYKVYIKGVTILSNKNIMNIRKIEYTKKDFDAIQLIKMEPSTFRLLVQSLCPLIYGHDIVKAGLILGLFGGSAYNDSGTGRTETHVLVVGDPGVGKSQLLQACGNIAPRGIYICGNSCTQAGLTVTVRPEKGIGSALEAGALVLADQGVCCIDELDKMSANQQALLEVMEQQVVSVAKAGVVCTLAARTSILAAANPIGGHYDKSKTVSENLKLTPAVLSRFDLVFMVLDRPNEHNDSLLTKHIQSLRCKNESIEPSSSQFRGNTGIFESSSTEDVPLLEKLKLRPNEHMDLLPQVLMHKYITYARKNYNPKLTVEAAMELKTFYLELRQVYQTGADTIPVTVRNLKALVRLTLARARIDLTDTATVGHARDVISIFRQSMADIYDVSSPESYMQRIPGASATGSLVTQTKNFLKVLGQRSRCEKKTVFSRDELKEMGNEHGFHVQFMDIIDKLNMQGVLLKKGTNIYKYLSDEM